jgi:phosphoglycolate phosphatase
MTIGYDPVAHRIQPGGPMAVGTMGEIQELVGAVLRRWCPSIGAARRILAEAWFEPDPVADAVPLADLPELFATLRSTGRSIAVATTDDRAPTEATLAGLGVAGQVQALLCGNDDGPTKPEPAALVALADRLGAAIGRTAMVGDTTADLQMARAAGARAIGVASGVEPAADLARQADLVVATVAELVGPAPADGPRSP